MTKDQCLDTDPSSVNAKKVQQILFDLEGDVLSPYSLPQNRVYYKICEKLTIHENWSVTNSRTAFPSPDSEGYSGIVKAWCVSDTERFLREGKSHQSIRKGTENGQHGDSVKRCASRTGVD